MSELKLKPIENSNLYKRRTTSRENLLHATASGGSDYSLTVAVGNYANLYSPEHNHSSQAMQTNEGMLYQNTPTAIRSIQYVNSNAVSANVGEFTANPNRSLRDADKFGEKHTFLNQHRQITDNNCGYSVTGESAFPANVIREFKSINLGTRQSPSIGPYQNLPAADSTSKPRKMELKDPTGRSNVEVIGVSANMSLGTMMCTRCDEGFEPHERIVNSNGQLWHTQCFVCAQCFRQFQDGIFYEFEGRKYCEKDFHILFAPCCNKCNDFVIGRVIKAMAANWHPECFTCERCNIPLADSGFIRNQNRALCHDCNRKEKEVGLGKHICNKCHGIIDEAPLRFRGEVYHGYHFNCTACGVELDSTAREVKNRTGYAANDMNELYCLRCHDRMGIPICGACRRPIEERVVTALGKHWHVEHFVCAKCEKPFLGHRHYEKRGLAYCETHYHQLFGNLCFVCNQVIAGDVFTALNKAWCVHHFSCSICDNKMDQKSKFYEYDEKPVCKKCYERFPAELRRRLRIAHENTLKKNVN
ncbi:LIM and senescent cell antigen-like-containing domain protein 1 [Sabethes cyaneus]|uniref:LIM and senescent cell antigen-like-containing domain protein 1 n=1 Tax=Sabethes cyaneus TaxID=53552 RepID=UPI00237E3369|nr:LIM and senescent cell antigen-like-containing domain protein 1 [Sabethes cyaneus]